MESSKAFDVPQSLTSEGEKRLLRVFCFLRQHERKARVTRKAAELQKLRCNSTLEPDSKRFFQFREEEREHDQDEEQAADSPAEPAVLFDQGSLLNELNLLSSDSRSNKIKTKAESRPPSNNHVPSSTAVTTPVHHEKEKKYDHVLELSREIRELQKGILHASLSCTDVPGCITAGDILSAMKAMNRSATKTDVQWMVWEADDDLDGCVDWHEFRSSYARALVDKHGLEPNQLYHVIQFLLCDTDESHTVSVLEIKAELKKLPGTDHLATKLLVALKSDAEQQLLQKFTLSEYLEIMLVDLPTSFPISTSGGGGGGCGGKQHSRNLRATSASIFSANKRAAQNATPPTKYRKRHQRLPSRTRLSLFITSSPPQETQTNNTASMSTNVCPTCSCTEIDIVDVSGEAVCVNCGTILEENNIVSSIEFHESGGGAHSVVGQFVSSTSSKSYGNIGTSGRNYGMESRANTLANGKKKIRQIAGMLRLGDHYVDSAFRLFALALQRNFTHGRKAQTVIAACLYIVCRRERSPHLLIDFSDKLQINVYVLGGVFLKFCKLLQIHLPLIDPSLYIHRFASQLNFAGKTHSIATTALRLVATMKRDWIETGRRPSGICGAALLIAARSQSVMCSLHDVMDVVNIGERTLKQRLYEFSLTPTAQLTYDQVGKLEMSRVECDPPSFQRHREKEVMEMLLLESERLPLENGRKRARKAEDNDEDEDEDGDEEDSLSDSDEQDSKTKKMKDEEMSRFLSGDAYYKKKHASALLSGGNGNNSSSGNGHGHAALKSDDDDDDEIDYGFENANEQIVNRASRLAAQEVLLRVRKKSARYIIRKREEADFYKTIERDLTLALEEEGSSIVKATLSNVMKSSKAKREREKARNGKQVRRRAASGSELEDDDDDGDGDDEDEENELEEEVDEEEEDAEDEEDENEDKAKPVAPEDPACDNGEDERSRDKEDQEQHERDNFSDLDDDEINSLLLTKEEADKKKILWEKMNKDFIQEQEEKRLNGLNAPEVPKKKRRKKVPDANVPPPDTAQHAIYKLKSRRINYEVIDELFGEAASNGF